MMNGESKGSSSPLWDPFVLAAGVTIGAVLLYLLRLWALPRPISGIPYDPESKKRLLGDFPNLLNAPSRRTWFVETARRHNSPLSQLFLIPFSRPIVVCVDPVEAQDICMRRLKEFKRNSQVEAIFGGAIPNHHITMADDDPRFKKNRELVRDLMTPAFLHEVSAPRIYDKATRLIDLWDIKMRISNGRPFEAGQDVHNVALDVIMSVAFNMEASEMVTARNIAHLEGRAPSDAQVDGADEPVDIENLPLERQTKAFTAITESVGDAFRSPVPRLRNWIVQRISPLKDAIADTDEMMHRELTLAVERMEAGEPPRCAMDQILLRERSIAEKEGRETDYFSATIRDELLGYLVAGHDTTSSAFRWGLKFLSQNQRAQRRLRDALREAFPDAAASGSVPTATEILKAHVPYLDAVVEEILRCCKTLPITSREARVDTQILGVHIPKGTVVMFLAHGPGFLTPAIKVDETRRTTEGARRAVERGAGVWDPEDVEAFVPERWLKTEGEAEGEGEGEGEEVFDAGAGPFMTFGYGPRACFGRRLAYLEMRILLVLLVWRFEMLEVGEKLNGMTALEGLTTVPRDCYVRLRRSV